MSVALAGAVIAIHHIGSTAVPGLCAKPIIDMLAIISAGTWRESHTQALERLTYIAKGEYGIPGRRFFIKPQEVMRTHHLHIFLQNHPDIPRHLALRDYLRAFPSEACRYGYLKDNLAQTYPHDIKAYMEGKASMVHAMEKEALAWAAASPAQAFD